jgi:hypothetical protein
MSNHPPRGEVDPAVCKHPITAQYSWIVGETVTKRGGKRPIVCIGCCDCGTILQGGATLPAGEGQSDVAQD